MGLYGGGKKVTSFFSGPADVNSFDLISHLPVLPLKQNIR
jgi:hypothetical protein